MNDIKGIRNVIIVVLVVILAITVSNFAIANLLGVNVSELPAGVKVVVHLGGLFVVLIVIKKLFIR